MRAGWRAIVSILSDSLAINPFSLFARMRYRPVSTVTSCPSQLHGSPFFFPLKTKTCDTQPTQERTPSYNQLRIWGLGASDVVWVGGWSKVFARCRLFFAPF